MKLKRTSPTRRAVSGAFKILSPRRVTEHPRINKCLALMEKRYCEPFQVRDFVRLSGMSRRGFLKAFSKNVGVNPGQFLSRIRLEHAKRLLVEYDLRLKEIALRCGYRNQNTFGVAFLREMKMSPKTFQRRYWLAAFRSQHKNGNSPMISNYHVKQNRSARERSGKKLKRPNRHVR